MNECLKNQTIFQVFSSERKTTFRAGGSINYDGDDEIDENEIDDNDNDGDDDGDDDDDSYGNVVFLVKKILLKEFSIWSSTKVNKGGF